MSQVSVLYSIDNVFINTTTQLNTYYDLSFKAERDEGQSCYFPKVRQLDNEPKFKGRCLSL